MLYIVLLILVVTAAICLGLSRVLATRWLGIGAAGITAIAALLLLAEQLGAVAVPLPTLTWTTLGELTVGFGPALSAPDLALALTVLGGSTLGLLALALALTPAVRGFGGLFAWSLLTLAAVLGSMAIGAGGFSLLLPSAWTLAVICGYSAVRASGALNRTLEFPLGITSGLLASLLLLGGMLLATPIFAQNGGPVAPVLGTAGTVIALLGCLMLAGVPPFCSTFDEAMSAPATLGGLLYGMVLPVLGLGTLIQALHGAAPLAPPWRAVLVGIGALGVLTATAGALREHSLRRMLGWQASAQAALVLLAAGLEGPLAVLAAPALLINLVLVTLAGALAVAAVERLTGSDDFTQVHPGVNLRLPGVLWALAGASSLGLPPLWGFWGRRWLLEAAFAQQPWAVPAILAATLLGLLVYLAPLACFWRIQHGTRADRPVQTPGVDLQWPLMVLAALPLLALGLAPQLAWAGWLRLVPSAPSALPVDTLTQIVAVAAALLGLGLALVARRPWVRQFPSDEDMEPVALAPDALANSLRPLAWVGRPTALLRGTWNGLQRLSRWTQVLMTIFEQRYYLAGVLLMLLIVILVMAQ